MGKKSRHKGATGAVATQSESVGPRQPCPCGSGRRYKACHGSANGPAPMRVRRPFAGLPNEADVVAVREFVPAATATVVLRDSDRGVRLCSLLPGASPAMVRDDGTIWLGLQVQHFYGDPSRDLGAVLSAALAADPGSVIGLTDAPLDAPRLQDLLTDDPIVFDVHQGFDFWLADVEQDESMSGVLEQANASAAPTSRLGDGAYWTRMGEREFLRLVLPHDEDSLLDALARIHASDSDHVIEGDRLIGAFRAHGLLAPVWEFELGTGPEPIGAGLPNLLAALDEALAQTTPLTSQERSARAGLASRHVTIR